MQRGDDLAGFLPRIGAALLDALVLVGLIAAVLSVTGTKPEEARELVVAGVLLISLLYATPLISRKGEHNGQTLGKQALAIRVVRADARPMTAGPALLREFVGKGLLGLIPFFSIVDYLMPFADVRRQSIHDKIATTYVVRADAVPDLPDEGEEPEERLGLSEDPFGEGR